MKRHKFLTLPLLVAALYGCGKSSPTSPPIGPTPAPTATPAPTPPPPTPNNKRCERGENPLESDCACPVAPTTPSDAEIYAAYPGNSTASTAGLLLPNYTLDPAPVTFGLPFLRDQWLRIPWDEKKGPLDLYVNRYFSPALALELFADNGSLTTLPCSPLFIGEQDSFPRCYAQICVGGSSCPAPSGSTAIYLHFYTARKTPQGKLAGANTLVNIEARLEQCD